METICYFVPLVFLLQISNGLPTVDKGVFVIVGVQSCGNGSGYCILGSDCSVDKEFIADSSGGHCDGLKTAFTPRANFLCCMLAEPDPTTTTTTQQTTTAFEEGPPSLESQETSAESPESTEHGGALNTSTTPHAIIGVSGGSVAPDLSISTTPRIIYEEKTEISVESSLSMEVLCGLHYGIGEARVASQNPVSASCFTAALVRSPTSLFSLSDPGSFLCTGAMITQDFLLTSATCVSRLYQQEDLSLFKVIPGVKHIVHPSHGLSTAEYRDIQEIHVHKDYSVNGHVRYDDIALVRLTPSNGTSSYCTICLPNEAEDWTESNCMVTGYSHPSDSSDSDGFLHEAPQHVESSEFCNRSTSIPQTRALEGLICTSGEKSAEACFSPRDAGSPLSCSIDNVLKLAGVFSSGFHCGSKESPVLYTDVRYYLPWIKTILKHQ